jgi:hypothetical protein
MSVAAVNYAVRICRLQDVAAKMVLTALAWKSQQETPYLAFIGNEQLRQETGLKSVNGVKDALRRLIAAGEVRIIEVGGRGQSTNYELVGVKQWLESGEVSPFDISDGDSKVSASDSKCQMATVKYRHLTPIDNKTIKTEDKGADAPAPAASQPSLPSSSPVAVPPPKPRPQKTKRAAPDHSSLRFPTAPALLMPGRTSSSTALSPIKGRINPNPPRRRIVLSDLAASTNSRPLKQSKDRHRTRLARCHIRDKPADAPKVVPIRTGPRQPSDAEKRMFALEALQAERMQGAA